MKRKSVHAKRFLIIPYAKYGDFIWFIRLNLVLMRGSVRCLEFTIGLLGVGLMVQWYYGKQRIDSPAKQA